MWRRRNIPCLAKGNSTRIAWLGTVYGRIRRLSIFNSQMALSHKVEYSQELLVAQFIGTFRDLPSQPTQPHESRDRHLLPPRGSRRSVVGRSARRDQNASVCP